MTKTLTLHRDSSGSRKRWQQCIDEARAGCRDAQARLFGILRPYLRNRVPDELDTGLRAKVSPSDVVQEVMLEAWEYLPHFRGSTRAELIAWLHKLLRHQSVDVARKYRAAAKRSIDREEPFMPGSSSPGQTVIASDPSPSKIAMGEERTSLVEQALRRLPATDEQVLRLRSQTELTFGEIGQILDISEDAARKRWARAAERLGRELKRHVSTQ